MLIPYSYDNAISLLELLKENKIARLQVTKKDDVTAIEYSLITEFSQSLQESIRNILAESLTERLYLVKLWHDFIVSKAAGRDICLEIMFNAVRVTKLEFVHRLVGNMIYSDMQNTDYEKALHCLESLDKVLTNMGIHDQQMIGVYHREGSGRSKKYRPMTFGEILEYIHTAVEK